MFTESYLEDPLNSSNNISSKLFSNSEAFASELLNNYEEIVSLYHIDLFSSFKPVAEELNYYFKNNKKWLYFLYIFFQYKLPFYCSCLRFAFIWSIYFISCSRWLNTVSRLSTITGHLWTSIRTDHWIMFETWGQEIKNLLCFVLCVVQTTFSCEKHFLWKVWIYYIFFSFLCIVF